MTDQPTRMVLRREADDAPTSAETVRQIGRSGAVVVDQGDRMLLIEGSDAAVAAASELAKGWRASPVQSYAPPDTRMRIKPKE